MVTIERVLSGANTGQLCVYIDNKLACEVEPIGEKSIDLEKGKYTFMVKSKILKSKET